MRTGRVWSVARLEVRVLGGERSRVEHLPNGRLLLTWAGADLPVLPEMGDEPVEGMDLMEHDEARLSQRERRWAAGQLSSTICIVGDVDTLRGGSGVVGPLTATAVVGSPEDRVSAACRLALRRAFEEAGESAWLPASMVCGSPVDAAVVAEQLRTRRGAPGTPHGMPSIDVTPSVLDRWPANHFQPMFDLIDRFLPLRDHTTARNPFANPAADSAVSSISSFFEPFDAHMSRQMSAAADQTPEAMRDDEPESPNEQVLGHRVDEALFAPLAAAARLVHLASERPGGRMLSLGEDDPEPEDLLEIRTPDDHFMLALDIGDDSSDPAVLVTGDPLAHAEWICERAGGASLGELPGEVVHRSGSRIDQPAADPPGVYRMDGHGGIELDFDERASWLVTRAWARAGLPRPLHGLVPHIQSATTAETEETADARWFQRLALALRVVASGVSLPDDGPMDLTVRGIGAPIPGPGVSGVSGHSAGPWTGDMSIDFDPSTSVTVRVSRWDPQLRDQLTRRAHEAMAMRTAIAPGFDPATWEIARREAEGEPVETLAEEISRRGNELFWERFAQRSASPNRALAAEALAHASLLTVGTTSMRFREEALRIDPRCLLARVVDLREDRTELTADDLLALTEDSLALLRPIPRPASPSVPCPVHPLHAQLAAPPSPRSMLRRFERDEDDDERRVRTSRPAGFGRGKSRRRGRGGGRGKGRGGGGGSGGGGGGGKIMSRGGPTGSAIDHDPKRTVIDAWATIQLRPVLQAALALPRSFRDAMADGNLDELLIGEDFEEVELTGVMNAAYGAMAVAAIDREDHLGARYLALTLLMYASSRSHGTSEAKELLMRFLDSERRRLAPGTRLREWCLCLMAASRAKDRAARWRTLINEAKRDPDMTHLLADALGIRTPPTPGGIPFDPLLDDDVSEGPEAPERESAVKAGDRALMVATLRPFIIAEPDVHQALLDLSAAFVEVEEDAYADDEDAGH